MKSFLLEHHVHSRIVRRGKWIIRPTGLLEGRLVCVTIALIERQILPGRIIQVVVGLFISDERNIDRQRCNV